MAEYGTTLRTVSFLKVLLVVALSKGQDDFPRLDDMNSFLGEPFTITCPEGLPTFRWFKGQDNNKDKQVALVVPSASIARCEGEFANRDCSISMETGDLTLGSVWIEDEGSYVCQKLFSGGPASQYRLKLLNVNVNPTDVNMTELKSPFPKPGEDFQITCTVERIRPANARVYFKLMRNGQAGPEINGLTDTVPNGDGTFKLTTTVQMKFNRTDDGERFRCIVHPQSGRGNKVTKDRKIFVRWEYKTEVQETDHDEKPIVGQSKRLSCYNSEENKGNPEAKQNDVRWMHNGHTVQNDARHDGASTRNLTINQLQKTDAGEYRCAISNRAGPGESLSDFYLRIWVAHTSKVQEATASEVPLVGSKKQLVCYRDKHGFPEEVKAVRWYKDGERISKMYQKYQISDYYLYIENLERSDAGKYTCHLVNEAGEGTSDEPYALNVYWAPEGQPRIKPASSVVGVKSGITLTCSTDEMDEGNPPSYYTIWTKHNDESFHRNKTGNKLQLWDIKSVTDGGRFYCKVGNMIGTSSVSQDVTVTVEAPVHIEELNPSDSQTVVYDDKTFEISCTASGSNINKVTWYKDGQPLDGKNNFRIWELETVEGNFKYGQTQAVESFLERQPKNLEFDCSNVNYYSGEYKCRMEGTMAGVTTSAESESVTIDTIYPALWAGKEKLTSASRDDESKQIVCDVCAEPPVDSFSWLFNGRSLRGGIEQNVNTLTIDRVFTDDFGVYTCTAKSDINGRWIYRTFDIELTERGKPHEPKDFEVVMQTSISVTVRWKAGFAAGYEPQAFRLEYRETTESEFEVYRENIPETNGWITETIMRLAPSSNYDIRLRAINRRPVMPNHSDYVSVEAKTKALPRVELTKVDVTETKIQVQWNFKSKGRSKRAVDEGYSVGVQIKYKKQSDKEYLTYPEDGNKLPADQESAVINGTFNIHEPYIVRIFVFEDDLQVESVSTESFKSSPLPKPVTASSTGGIIGGVIAVLVVIIIAAVLFILYKRRQHRKRTKGRNLELAGGKTNQRSSAGYSPLANHHEEIPYRYTCGPGQVNGDKPYMNVDELNGHGGYDEASSADNLYESVDNHPGSVRKCPAGPPPPPAEEPLYSKPNKKKNKKDKKDKEAKEPQAAKENPYANTTNGALGDNPYQNVDYKKSASQEDLYDDVASPQSGGSQEDLTKTGEEIVYADLDIKPDAKKPKKKKKPVVNQSEPATEYAVIDFTKKAPPAADDDDDDDDEC